MQFLKKIENLRQPHSREVRSFTEDFVTTVTDISMTTQSLKRLGFESSEDDDCMVNEATLKWSLEPEYRNYGIKDFGVFVPDQKIAFRCRLNDEDVIKTLDVKNIEVEYDSSGGSPHLFPIRLDYFDDKWTVTFNIG